MSFDPTCDVIIDVQIKFCNIFGKFKPRAMLFFGLRIGQLVVQLSWVGGARRPPPSADRVQENPIGVQVIPRSARGLNITPPSPVCSR